MSRDYRRVNDYPRNVDAAGVIARMLDALGFRFYWATVGLDEEDYEYLPTGAINSLGKVVEHFRGLMNWVHGMMIGGEVPAVTTFAENREQALELVSRLHEHVSRMSSDDLLAINAAGLPFWHIVNGPLADALTHVGQINYVRRMMGKPSPGANVFTCEPPKAS